MQSLILASQSPNRLQLLRDAGYDVVAIPSEILEPDPRGFTDIDAGLMFIASLKARAAWRKGGEGLILGADTVGVVDDRVFGKPVDRSDARRMLAAISGTRHQVCTGWCLLSTRDKLCISGCERTTIAMRPWSTDEIDRYLDSGEWIGKSGAYGVQLPLDPFIIEIVGSQSNVIGIPLERLAEVLKVFDVA